MIQQHEATVLAHAGQRIGEGERRAVVEQGTLMTLLGNEAVHQAQQDYIDLGGDEQEESMMHKHVVFQCLSQYPPAVRLRRILLRPDTVNEDLANAVRQWYAEREVNLDGQGLGRLPRRHDLLVDLMIAENVEKQVAKLALDVVGHHCGGRSLPPHEIHARPVHASADAPDAPGRQRLENLCRMRNHGGRGYFHMYGSWMWWTNLRPVI